MAVASHGDGQLVADDLDLVAPLFAQLDAVLGLDDRAVLGVVVRHVAADHGVHHVVAVARLVGDVDRSAFVMGELAVVQLARLVVVGVDLANDHAALLPVGAGGGDLVNGEHGVHRAVHAAGGVLVGLGGGAEHPVVLVHTLGGDAGVAAADHLAQLAAGVGGVFRGQHTLDRRTKDHPVTGRVHVEVFGIDVARRHLFLADTRGLARSGSVHRKRDVPTRQIKHLGGRGLIGQTGHADPSTKNH